MLVARCARATASSYGYGHAHGSKPSAYYVHRVPDLATSSVAPAPVLRSALALGRASMFGGEEPKIAAPWFTKRGYYNRRARSAADPALLEEPQKICQNRRGGRLLDKQFISVGYRPP